MSLLKNIVITVAVVVVGVLAYASTRPKSFRVQRSVTVKASPEKIAAYISDFHNWSEWSPWEKLDPALQRKFGGPQSGVGTNYEWVGNNKVGTGRMEIRAIDPGRRVEIQLDFLKPFEAHNTAEFTLTPQGDSTEVSWAMFGPATFMTKLMGVFVSMDSMIGKDFEAGLATMKGAMER